MTFQCDAKFEEKLTRGLENNKRDLANFHQCTRKSQNWDFHSVLLSKREKKFEIKIYSGVSVMTMKNNEKSEEELTCRFKIDIRNWTNFDLRA